MDSKQPRPPPRPTGGPSRTARAKPPSFLRPSKPSILPGGHTQTSSPSAGLRATKPTASAQSIRPVGSAPQPPAPAPRKYCDYKLVMRASKGKVHYVMKLHSSKPVDPATFTPPLKLRRRDRASIQQILRASQEVAQAQGPDAALAEASQSAAQGATAQAPDPPARGSGPGAKIDTSVIAPYGGATRNKQLLFKKRTRQIYLADESVRKLKEVESKPWFLEDFDRQELWTGHLEGGQRSPYVLFVLVQKCFQVVPARRWYKFAPKIQYATLSIDEAEEQIKKSQKEEDDRWIMKKRGAKPDADKPSAATASLGSLDRLNQAMTASPNPQREDFGHGTLSGRPQGQGADELDYEEDFQDDEEGGGEYEPQDDEAKDAAERAKQQVRRFGMDGNPDDDNDEDEAELDETGKQLKHLVRDLEKNKAYDSDQDQDPYASDDDLFEEVDVPTDLEPAATKAPGSPVIKPTSKKDGSPKASAATKRKEPAASAKKRKRPASVPKASPKAEPVEAIRGPAATPLASDGPAGARATDAASKKARLSPATKPSVAAPLLPKGDAPSPGIGGAGASDSLITEQEVVALIRGRHLTPKELISHFKAKLRANPQNGARIKTFVRKLATTRDGVLELRADALAKYPG
ncbi:transcription factor IIF subunit tfg1 [Dimargaris verticillata]|uniref:Transcription initiation factor IIF subunit alpha n=1 Tax=Dimargaris verticillata TaxID=2761393 RepID=A0A9W8BCW3_9FUNG|nr:transcription factor IIF subunit tfg1 [Dimargaris verticillata]